MRSLVVDCSVTMAWCFEDECDDLADAVLDRLADGEAWVPSLWPPRHPLAGRPERRPPVPAACLLQRWARWAEPSGLA